MEFPVSIHIPDLRPKSTTLQGISSEILANMTGKAETLLDAEDIQQVDGPSPVYDSTNQFGIKIGNVSLAGNPTANRAHVFQDKDGAVALLDDAYGIRPTVILAEGLVTIDWTVSDNFVVVLARHRQSAIYMARSHAGMELNIVLVNNGTDQTIGDWDPLIKWPSGTATDVPAAGGGASGLQRVNLVNVNGTIFGTTTEYSGGPFPV